MKILKKILKGLGILIIAFLAFAFWYRYTYSMDYVTTYEVNSSSLEKRILIATQGSEYKNELVKSIIDSLQSAGVYIRVIDISRLEENYEDRWNAIVLLHTWEYSQPPESIDAFFANNPDQNKMIIVTTSGSGEEKMMGVDALTGASVKDEIVGHRTAILSFLRNTADL